MSQSFPLSFLDRDTVDALAGTEGTPSENNKYVTGADTRLTDSRSADSISIIGGDLPIIKSTPSNGQILRVSSDGNSIVFTDFPAHANEAGGSLHAAVTASENGFMSFSDKIKLDSISIATVAPQILVPGASVIGTSTKYAKEDHKHGIGSGIPSTIGLTNTEGTSLDIARRDHIHAHGNQTNPSLHALATTSASGFMSSSDKQKLDEFISPGTISTNRFDLYESTLSTTSTTDQLFHTWNTSTMDAGTYLVRWMFTYSTQTYSIPAIMTLKADNVTLIQHTMASAYDGNEQIGAIGIAQVTFSTDGNHSFSVYLHRGGATIRWVALYKSYIELVRVL